MEKLGDVYQLRKRSHSACNESTIKSDKQQTQFADNRISKADKQAFVWIINSASQTVK